MKALRSISSRTAPQSAAQANAVAGGTQNGAADASKLKEIVLEAKALAEAVQELCPDFAAFSQQKNDLDAELAVLEDDNEVCDNDVKELDEEIKGYDDIHKMNETRMARWLVANDTLKKHILRQEGIEKELLGSIEKQKKRLEELMGLKKENEPAVKDSKKQIESIRRGQEINKNDTGKVVKKTRGSPRRRLNFYREVVIRRRLGKKIRRHRKL